MTTYSKSTLAAVMPLLIAWAFVGTANESQPDLSGSICLTEVLSKAPNPAGWTKRQFIQVGSGKKISFAGFPKTAISNLDRSKKHLIRIYWDDKQLASWWAKFDEGVYKLAVFFRPGYWRMKNLARDYDCDVKE